MQNQGKSLPKYNAKEVETQGNFAPALDNGEKEFVYCGDIIGLSEFAAEGRNMMFVVNDPRRYQIQLTKTCWYHHILVEHPEMKKRLEDIRQALETPDCIYQSKYKSSSQLYFLKKRRGSFGVEYVLVVVTIRQRTKKGYVQTSFIVDSLSKGGKLLWKKR